VAGSVGRKGAGLTTPRTVRRIVGMGASNAELVREGFEAVSRGDFELIGALLAPDVKWHGGEPSDAGACQNRKQALAVMERAFKAGAIGTLLDVAESGDQVVVTMRVGGAEAREVANLTTFRDGQVVEMVHYADPGAAFAAAGL
jgi:ketosteroid isomerase-like protein